MAAIPLGQVEHDTARRALHLIGGFSAVLPKLSNHRAECSNQIQRDFIGNQHAHSPR